MGSSDAGDSLPVHATISDMYKSEFPKTHDVVIRMGRNDDTEILSIGTLVECRIYIQGYVHALLSETAYYIHPESAGNSSITLYSPLVSQHLIEIWVEETGPASSI